MVTQMAPLPQFIDVPRPTKRRRVEMPSVADGFNAPRHRPQFKHVHPVPTSAPKTPLKQVLPPSFSLPVSKPLHPPRPPPLPIQNSPDRDLKTISTTSIGLLNSLNDGEDLAAFLLPHCDQSTVVTPTSRGIDLSPEKRGKGHFPKFIRGGLAARASTLFNRAHTSLVLWQKETERRTNTGSTLPHLTATIVGILHLPPNSNVKPLVVVTLCRIHHTDSSYAPNQLYKIIFSVPHLSLDRIKEGLTVRIFHPWHELSSPRPSPASLPLPLSLSTSDFPINTTTALFCSRIIF